MLNAPAREDDFAMPEYFYDLMGDVEDHPEISFAQEMVICNVLCGDFEGALDTIARLATPEFDSFLTAFTAGRSVIGDRLHRKMRELHETVIGRGAIRH